jgi:hypothetical protein
MHRRSYHPIFAPLRIPGTFYCLINVLMASLAPLSLQLVSYKTVSLLTVRRQPLSLLQHWKLLTSNLYQVWSMAAIRVLGP